MDEARNYIFGGDAESRSTVANGISSSCDNHLSYLVDELQPSKMQH